MEFDNLLFKSQRKIGEIYLQSTKVVLEYLLLEIKPRIR